MAKKNFWNSPKFWGIVLIVLGLVGVSGLLSKIVDALVIVAGLYLLFVYK